MNNICPLYVMKNLGVSPQTTTIIIVIIFANGICTLFWLVNKYFMSFDKYFRSCVERITQIDYQIASDADKSAK